MWSLCLDSSSTLSNPVTCGGSSDADIDNEETEAGPDEGRPELPGFSTAVAKEASAAGSGSHCQQQHRGLEWGWGCLTAKHLQPSIKSPAPHLTARQLVSTQMTLPAEVAVASS